VRVSVHTSRLGLHVSYLCLYMCVHNCEVVLHVLSCKYTVYIFVRGHACAHANTLCTYL